MEHLQVPKKMGKWAAWESGESEKGELGMLGIDRAMFTLILASFLL